MVPWHREHRWPGHIGSVSRGGRDRRCGEVARGVLELFDGEGGYRRREQQKADDKEGDGIGSGQVVKNRGEQNAGGGADLVEGEGYAADGA